MNEIAYSSSFYLDIKKNLKTINSVKMCLEKHGRATSRRSLRQNYSFPKKERVEKNVFYIIQGEMNIPSYRS